ncbi:lysophospholipid acyltransferase family protein, partial [Streptomyces kronopolitis]
TLGYTQQGQPSTVAAFCGEDTFAASLRRVLAARALTVRVTAHPALTAADGCLDRREMAELAARAVLGGRPGAGAVVRQAPARPALLPAAPLPGSAVPDAPVRDTPAHV